MRERPILFSGPMVRALLAGTKTQTRRAVKPQPANDPAKHHPIEPYRTSTGAWNWVLAATGHGTGDPFPCPYGKPGDRLWVRETWAGSQGNVVASSSPAVPVGSQRWMVAYRASYEGESSPFGRWRPSIHMPRAVSRITLEITAVRVERLQAISEADAAAEGVDEWGRGALSPESQAADATDKFRWLWDSINGAGPARWDANPWVWVVEFRRVQP